MSALITPPERGPHGGTHLVLDRKSSIRAGLVVSTVEQGHGRAVQRPLVFPRRDADVERPLEEVEGKIPVPEGGQQESVLVRRMTPRQALVAARPWSRDRW
jgi:hypothetical protein